MSAAVPVYTKKDFQTDQEVRWCPGCGDYAILSAVQSVFPELNMGQLVKLLRAEYLVPAEGYSKVQGLPFGFAELEREIERRL